MLSQHGIIKCLLSRIMYGTIERLSEVPWSENTDVTLLKIDDDNNIELVFYNDHSHLPEELLPSGSRINSYINVNSEE